jgi:hypothetical protein
MRRFRAIRAFLSLRLAIALPLAAVTLAPSVVSAQSAADKATARELAVAGIKQFKKGEFAPALEKLQKAQALYDAHVHLVYIARCYVELGQLVEGAEAYRALARKPIPRDASDAVRRAQSEGAEELTALEPRIPKLRVDVEPAGVEGLQISINGQEVPAAIVGVDRPANPGEVVVRVGAPGYKTGEATVAIGEGGREAVTIVLEEGEGGVPIAEGQSETPQSTSQGSNRASPEEPPAPKPVSFVIEPRLSALAPIGKIGDRKATDVIRGGGGGELRFGVHFLKRFTGLVMVEAHGLAPISGFDSFAIDGFDSPDTDENESSFVDTASTETVGRVGGGLGFMYSTPHHQLGYFVELDLLGEYMTGSTTLVIKEDDRATVGFGECSTDVMLSGGGARLNGGGVIPLSQLLALTPYISAGVAGFSEGVLRGDCEQEVTVPIETLHGWVGLGVGVQFMLGE